MYIVSICNRILFYNVKSKSNDFDFYNSKMFYNFAA
jgi:hypothetical protein